MSNTAREPVLNVPAPIVVMVAVLLGVHIWASLASPYQQYVAIHRFGFVPARLADAAWGFEAALMWISYAFLHGSWSHLGFNSLWLLIFGTPVLRRIGLARFIVLCIIGSISAVGLHLAIYWDDPRPVIGASGVVSALTGAAARFAFAPHGRPGVSHRGPTLSIAQTLTSRGPLVFVAVWMIANVVMGAGLIGGSGAPSVAWEAHIGGFLAGLLTFSAFDRQSMNRSDPSDSSSR